MHNEGCVMCSWMALMIHLENVLWLLFIDQNMTKIE